MGHFTTLRLLQSQQYQNICANTTFLSLSNMRICHKKLRRGLYNTGSTPPTPDHGTIRSTSTPLLCHNRKAEVEQELQKTKQARNLKSSNFTRMAQQHHHEGLSQYLTPLQKALLRATLLPRMRLDVLALCTAESEFAESSGLQPHAAHQPSAPSRIAGGTMANSVTDARPAPAPVSSSCSPVSGA